jgi:acetate kinase
MPHVLTLNGGSSSIRFAFYDVNDTAKKLLDGKVERLGLDGTTLTIDGKREPFAAGGSKSAGTQLMQRLESLSLFQTLAAVGHRVVHGMQRSKPEQVTRGLLEELKKIRPFDPEHLPQELALIETLAQRYDHLPQAVCFDTAFHRTMPRVATIVPIPRRYAAQGVQRYGFHGLSYTFLMAELERLEAAGGRIVLAHLGNGASLAAVSNGRCIDTSMGFTPSSGIPMSTRSGDLDPGVLSFLALSESLDAAALQRMVNHESGLKGISETSSDIRDLLAAEAQDVRAAEAVALFCYQVRKCIGSYAAALGGIDTLVFAGGIGENSGEIRARICAGLEFLGIELNDDHNSHSAALISKDTARVAVRVIRTDEESVIARSTVDVLGLAHKD